jgi:hypothetical protein
VRGREWGLSSGLGCAVERGPILRTIFTFWGARLSILRAFFSFRGSWFCTCSHVFESSKHRCVRVRVRVNPLALWFQWSLWRLVQHPAGHGCFLDSGKYLLLLISAGF